MAVGAKAWKRQSANSISMPLTVRRSWRFTCKQKEKKIKQMREFYSFIFQNTLLFISLSLWSASKSWKIQKPASLLHAVNVQYCTFHLFNMPVFFSLRSLLESFVLFYFAWRVKMPQISTLYVNHSFLSQVCVHVWIQQVHNSYKCSGSRSGWAGRSRASRIWLWILSRRPNSLVQWCCARSRTEESRHGGSTDRRGGYIYTCEDREHQLAHLLHRSHRQGRKLHRRGQFPPFIC